MIRSGLKSVSVYKKDTYLKYIINLLQQKEAKWRGCLKYNKTKEHWCLDSVQLQKLPNLKKPEKFYSRRNYKYYPCKLKTQIDDIFIIRKN